MSLYKEGQPVTVARFLLPTQPQGAGGFKWKRDSQTISLLQVQQTVADCGIARDHL